MKHGTDKRGGQSTLALATASELAEEYLATIADREVAPGPAARSNLAQLGGPLPLEPQGPAETLRLLHEIGSPATVASAGGRFFGLVVGATLPAALGARVLTSAWDQIVFSDATSPVGIEIERVAGAWLLELLGLPTESSVGFVTGATMGNFTCLASARQHVLARSDWDVDRQGLMGAPPIRIVASEQIHVTVLKALRLLGLGTDTIEYVACDENGAMLIDAVPMLDEHTIVLTQAGNVNSGAFDPIEQIVDRANGAWVHVDGAFGLWAAASPEHKIQLQGYEKADSWVVDGHKWLNTPYDCGIAICRHPKPMHKSMATVAPYLASGGTAAPKDMVPEFSRSARAAEVWAALHSLGARGIADLVVRCCQHAKQMAEGLEGLGFEVLNEVCLNQVVATLPGRQEHCLRIAQEVQESGEAWFGTTVWKGQTAIRLSFSSWRTTKEDVQRTLAAIEGAMRH